MQGQGCRDLFERSVTVSLAEKVEPKSRQTLFIEEAGQGPVGRTVFAGKKSMAQYGETRRWSVRAAQDRGNAVTMAIVKRESFFHGMIFPSNRLLKNQFNTLELLWSGHVAEEDSSRISERDRRDELDGPNEAGIKSVHVAPFSQASRFTRHGLWRWRTFSASS